MIAALFVEAHGVYSGRPDVEVWDVARDARTYAGPHRVVAHPPCERWGKYATGGPNPLARRRTVGDDGGCFASALASVRRWGGVLEHPASSKAWAAHGLVAPPPRGGWVVADFVGGWTCHVEQGHWGHKARKATWLYACGIPPAPVTWGKAEGAVRLEEGWHSTAERQAARAAGIAPTKRASRADRIDTPVPFAELLLSLVGDPARTGPTEEQSRD